jgi:hypothetical protein
MAISYPKAVKKVLQKLDFNNMPKSSRHRDSRSTMQYNTSVLPSPNKHNYSTMNAKPKKLLGNESS